MQPPTESGLAFPAGLGRKKSTKGIDPLRKTWDFEHQIWRGSIVYQLSCEAVL
jgi:hypothetical protein